MSIVQTNLRFPLPIFQTQDAARVLGTTQLRLNRLMTRFGIEPSVNAGTGKGSRRLFSIQDVATLGLALWLFRVGLWAKAIESVLREHRVKKLLGRLTDTRAIAKAGKENQFLVTWRVSRGQDRAIQKATFIRDLGQFDQLVARQPGAGFVLLPVGGLLQGLDKAVREFLGITK